MTERQVQIMQFLYDHANNIDAKSTELHEIATMMRNCLHELETGEENIYTKTCRMDKEFAEDELERTKKKLDIAVDALEKILNAQGRCWGATDTDIKFDCKHYADEALNQINQKEQQ